MVFLVLFCNLASRKFGLELYIFARELDLPRPCLEPRLLIRAHARELLTRAREAYLDASNPKR